MNATTDNKDIATMPKERTILIYKYDELSERAKERARDWLREASAGDSDWSEYVIEDFAKIAAFCGWDIKQRAVKLMGGGTRMEPQVYWSGFGTQGSGACFEGEWSPSAVNSRGLRAYAPRDKELRSIGARFNKLKRAIPCLMDAGATASHTGRGEHELTVTFEARGLGTERTREAREESLVEASRDLMRWLYRALEREYEYQNSDEQIAENIRANEYEFDENGKRA
jgi:hypothetical protein